MPDPDVRTGRRLPHGACSSPDESRPASRHPLRARPHRAEDAAQPLLPGAALHRVRRREAVVAGAPPRRQGRGRLGGRQHRVLHDQRRVRRDAVRLGAHVGRRRRAACCAATCDEAHRHGALAGIELSHTGAHGENSESRLPAAAPVADRERLRHGPRAARDDEARHPPRAGRLGASPPSARAAPASTSSTSTARTRTCRGSSCRRTTTAHGRVRRLAREPRALLARDARGGARRRRRRLRDRLPRRRRPHGRRSASTSTRASSSCAWPTTSSTSGTSPSARSPSGRSTPARRASSPRAGSSRAPARVREATAKPIVGVSRLTDPDLMAEIVRSGVWDLIGAARPVDRRPLPAAQDRRGPRRRDPRVHRLQRLHLEGRQPAPHRLHAERDRRRGAPARLAPRALRAAAAPASTRSSSAAARPAWSARSRSRRRGAARVRLVDARAGDGRPPRLAHAPARALAEWGRLTAYRMAALKRLPNVELVNDRELTRAEIAARRRRRGRARDRLAAGRRTASTRFTRAPIPGAEAPAAHILTPEQIVLDGAAPARAAASSSTTATATSWRPRSPSCSRARAARSSS